VTRSAFSPAIEAALDRYTVAAVPDGFADRLLARLQDGGAEVVADPPIFATPRPRAKGFSGPWARSGRILGSTALFGLVTAAAAASGLLGEPVYVPGVSEVLAKADIIAPVQKPKAPVAIPHSASAKAPVPVAAKPAPSLKGKDAVRALVAQLKDDPEYRALPLKARQAIARAEAIELVRSGTVSGPELREALGEMRAEARPIIKARIEEAAARRRAANTGTESAKPSSTENTDPQQPPTRAANQNKERVKALRERYRNASPEERAQIRQRIRERTGADPNNSE
jgi:hypothetical protein